MEDGWRRQGDLLELGGEWRATPKGPEYNPRYGLPWSEYREGESGQILD